MFLSRISDSILDHPQRWAGAVFLLSLSLLALPAYRWLEAERSQVGAVSRSVDAQGAATREWLRANAIPILQQVSDNANARAQQGIGSIDAAVGKVLGDQGQLTALRGDVIDIATMLSGQLGEGVQQITDLRESLAPTVAHLNEASAELPGVFRDGRFLLARGARTAGHIEQAADKIEAAVPQFLLISTATGLKIQEAATETAATTVQTRIAMAHLAEATKPLPKWIRYPLAITGALAPTVSGAVSAAAAAGAFR